MRSTLNLAVHLSASHALLLLTLGLLLIYYELNRPGSIFPGTLGLLASLIATASFANLRLSLVALVLVLTAVLLLAVELYKRTRLLVSVAATFVLILGLANLVFNAGYVYHLTAIVCGLVLGGGTSALTRIARRARVNKQLD